MDALRSVILIFAIATRYDGCLGNGDTLHTSYFHLVGQMVCENSMEPMAMNELQGHRKLVAHIRKWNQPERTCDLHLKILKGKTMFSRHSSMIIVGTD